MASNRTFLTFLNTTIHNWFKDSEVIKEIYRLINGVVVGSYIPTTEKGVAGGVATLDSGTKVPMAELPYGSANKLADLDGNGKIPVAYLPNSVMEFKGVWDATSPAYVNGSTSTYGGTPNISTLNGATPSIGDVYRVSVSGTNRLDAISGEVYYDQGDYVVYSDTQGWQISPSSLTSLKQGGNTFSATYVAGTTDNYGLQLITNNTTRATIDTSGNMGLGIGTTTAVTKFVVGDTSSSSPRGFMSWQSSNDTNGARFHLRKSRGTFASPTTTVNDGIVSVSVNAGGSGYSIGNVLTLSGGTGGTVIVTHVAAGVVDAVNIVTMGTGYTTGSKATTGGGNNACTITVNEVGSALGRIVSSGYDGTQFTENTNIQMASTGTISSGIVPSTMSFYTTDGNGYYNEALKVSSDRALMFPRNAGVINPAGKNQYLSIWNGNNGILNIKPDTYGMTKLFFPNYDAVGSSNYQTFQFPNLGAIGSNNSYTLAVLEAAQTFTAAQTITKDLAAIASTSALLMSGTWYSGGSATTTKPHFLIEPAGTTSTGWNTSGTGLGVNAASGFGGDLINLQIAGVTYFGVNATGRVLIGGSPVVGAASAKLHIFSNNYGTSSAFSASGFGIKQEACTYTSTTASNQTPTTVAVNSFGIPTLSHTGGNTTSATNATTWYIAGAPICSTGVSAGNLYGLFIEAGASYFGGRAKLLGGIQTFTTSTQGNLFVNGGTSLDNTTDGHLQYNTGSSGLNERVAIASFTTAALNAGYNYANQIVGASPITSGASGTNIWAANLAIKPIGAITAGANPITNTASLYVDGAYAGSNSTNNYALYVNSGTSLFGGVAQFASGINQTGGVTSTSGIANGINLTRDFTPTSGTASWSSVTVAPIINQTGGANGITRGIYINPTLTSAYDFRAIEVAAGNVLIGTSTNNGSTLQVNGSISKAYVARGTNITLGASDYFVNLTSTGLTASLPSAIGIAGREYVIKLTAAGTATIDVGATGQRIDGVTPYSLSAQNKYIKVVSDGANWMIIGNN